MDHATWNSRAGITLRSRSALITSTALALLLSASGAFAEPAGIIADNEPISESNVSIETGDAKWSHAAQATNNGILLLDQGSIVTIGERSYGLLSQYGGSITSNVNITTNGINAHAVQAGGAGTDGEAVPYTGSTKGHISLTGGTITVNKPLSNASWAMALHAIDQGTIDASNIEIVSSSYGVVSESQSDIKIHNSMVTTYGDGSHAIVANNDRRKDNKDLTSAGGTLTVNNTTVTTSGSKAHGVTAQWGGNVTLTGGSITTGGAKAHGLDSSDGGSIIADNVSIVVNSTADQTFGANATGQDSAIEVNGGSITTAGNRGYGLIAQNGGHITSSANITTNGDKAHAVQAGGNGTSSSYDGSTQGTIELTGGIITVNAADGAGWGSALHAVDSGTINASNITIGSKSFAALAESQSAINISDSRINTTGSVSALVANNDRVKNNVAPSSAGTLTVNNSVVTTSGANAHGASAEWGGTVTITGGSITTSGASASALNVINSGNIQVTGTELSSANAATIQVSLGVLGEDDTKDNGAANITLGAGTVATVNNGTLLQVNRTDAGSDGEVTLTLGAGSTSSGNIVDQGVKTTGWTDVTLEQGADWTGKLAGIRNFFGFQGGSVDFTERAEIAGSLNGSGTSYTFSAQGGSIGGDVNLNDGSSTTGGSIDNRIVVNQNVNVDDTSILGGNWSIGRNLTISGILSPGNSIGRVDIVGDLNLSPSSVYNVDVDLSGDADLITVGDVANLDGTVVVTAMDGYKLASPYTILTAGTIDGEFQSASLAQPSAFLDANLAHGANDVTLTIDRNATSFESVADTSNQAAVAGALDRMDLSNPVVAAIALSSSTEARDAFQQLSGDTNASVKTGLIETANLTADAINNRLRSAFDGVGAANMPVLSFAQSSNSAAGSAIDDVSASPSYNYAFWATGFGSWIDHDGNANAGGMKTSTGGFLSGLDIGLNSGWRLGVVGGYSETNLDAKGRNASAKSDNWHLGIYGGNQWGALGVRGGLIHTWHDVDSSRSVVYGGQGENLSADYDARTLQAFAEVGYQIDMAPVSFEPFANLSHVRLRTNGFTESGGDAALAATSETTNTTFTTLGLRASAPLQFSTTDANLKGMIGWRHAYGDRTPIATQAFAGGDAFTVQGIPIAKDAALFEAGMDFHVSQAATFGVSYVGQFGSKTTQNGFNASFNVKF